MAVTECQSTVKGSDRRICWVSEGGWDRKTITAVGMALSEGECEPLNSTKNSTKMMAGQFVPFVSFKIKPDEML